MEEKHFDEEKKQNVCRDYLRNACERGISCKYLHTPAKLKNENENNDKVIFCHDYQNGKCSRIECRFLHCSKEQENFYLEHGKKPNDYETQQLSINRPICKDYQKGDCRRSNCIYRHIPMWSSNNTPLARQFVEPVQKPAPMRYISSENNYSNPVGIENLYRRQHEVDDFEIVYKRRRYQDMPSPPVQIYCPPNSSEANGYNAAPRSMWSLEDENAVLRKQVAELSKRVNNLQATNEFLLEQNAHLRNEKQVPRLTAVTVPAVTITNSASLPPQAPTAHQIVNAIRTVTASVATVPVSLAAVTGTPVSIATVSMAPVQMSPVVTMAAPQALNHSLRDPQHATSSPCPQW